MANVRSVYGGQYLQTSEVGSDPVTARIIGVHFNEQIGKITLDLDGIGKELVLNKTNAGAIALELGDETDAWLGGEITFAVARVMYMGKSVDGIRVTGARRFGTPAGARAKK